MLGVSFGLSEVDGLTTGLGLDLGGSGCSFTSSTVDGCGSSVGGGGMSS
ncbi:hypothetical protein [Ekhidna sp.]